jgi:hypothetical protein
MPLVRFEPVIPATKPPQTYALGRAVTGIGIVIFTKAKYKSFITINA